jgi:hypothetical protein
LNRATVEDASGRTTLFPMTTCDLAHGKIIAGTLATPGLSTASNWVYALAGGNRERTKQKDARPRSGRPLQVPQTQTVL